MMKSQARSRGIIELVIDEQGRPSSISVRESIQPMYDAELMKAARDWRYQPATLRGKPVKYRKLIQLNINREQ
jgi:TonB family protein